MLLHTARTFFFQIDFGKKNAPLGIVIVCVCVPGFGFCPSEM